MYKVQCTCTGTYLHIAFIFMKCIFLIILAGSTRTSRTWCRAGYPRWWASTTSSTCSCQRTARAGVPLLWRQFWNVARPARTTLVPKSRLVNTLSYKVLFRIAQCSKPYKYIPFFKTVVYILYSLLLYNFMQFKNTQSLTWLEKTNIYLEKFLFICGMWVFLIYIQITKAHFNIQIKSSTFINNKFSLFKS